MVQQAALGVYRQNEPKGAAAVGHIEEELGAPVSLVSVFRAFNRMRVEDDLAWLAGLAEVERPLMVTWEPWNILGPEPTGVSLSRIASGGLDGYAVEFLRELARLPQAVIVRPMHEANGDWYPWSVGAGGREAALYRRAFSTLREAAEKAAPGRFAFAFTPCALPGDACSPARLKNLLPGCACEWVGGDGYNFGGPGPEHEWRFFGEIFAPMLDALGKIAPGKKTMIGEFACAEGPGDKPGWILDAAETLAKKFPQVELAVWFDEDKERDWRVVSNPASRAAFAKAFGNSRKELSAFP